MCVCSTVSTVITVYEGDIIMEVNINKTQCAYVRGKLYQLRGLVLHTIIK